ncbi:MAG TPA: hypothetical protein VGD42_08900 [Lysobacter sp.]
MESPPAGGWAVVSRSLASHAAPSSIVGRREQRANWLIWTASAAVLAVVAWAPLERWLGAPQDTVSAKSTAAAAPARSERDTGARAKDPADQPMLTDRIENGARVASTPVTTKVPAASLPIAGDATPKRPKPARAPASSSRTASSATVAATPEGLQPPIDVSPSTNTAVAATTPVDPLPRLYAESAQLEALVALARDDRVASASGAVLTGELDARIGLIDAALSQSDLSPAQRSALWRQRIDALRELAGVESTERWLAAQGERLDGALVRVD